MKAKALRLPDKLLHVVKFAEKRERLDEPTALRKFLWLGAEKYIAELYSRGEISLREASSVLEITTREALELFWDLGIRGNVGADMAVQALQVAEKKARYGA